jgi:hypothetical protein
MIRFIRKCAAVAVLFIIFAAGCSDKNTNSGGAPKDVVAPKAPDGDLKDPTKVKMTK